MSIKSFMDLVRENQRVAMENKQAISVPDVGIFWVYGGKVYGTYKPLGEADMMGDYKYDKTTHYMFWEGLKERNPELPQDKEFNEVPRGRVAYVISEKAYHIISNPDVLGDTVTVDKIKNFFNIRSGFNVVLEAEEQYNMDFRG